MRIRLCSCITLLLCVVARSAPADAPPATGTWRAGVAKANITPTQPMWLAGYGGRDHPAEGKLHDVWIKAVALEDAKGERVVLLTSDLCGIPKWMDDRVSDAIHKEHGLDRSRIRLTYSHNHCAPVVRGDLEDYYPLDETQQRLVDEYSDRLEKEMIRIIGAALASLAPATLNAGDGVCTFAVNRRNNRESDVPDLLARGQTLQGPVDHRVPVLCVRSADGQLLAVVFAYACHHTTLSFYQWCGDYAGFAQIALESSHPGATALFVNGCGGDQNPLPRRTVELCEKYGHQLAASVEAVLGEPMHALEPELRTAFESVTLAFERNPTREELEQHAAGTNPIRARWARRFLNELDAGERLVDSAPFAVQAWRLGEQDWISLGGETLVDYAHRFRAEYGAATWVTSYSADLTAYIPSRRNILEGGYEGTNLFEYMHPADRWALDTEQRIAAAVDRLMIQVRGRGRDALHAAAPLDPRLAGFFEPPPEFAGEFGPYRSPLRFADGSTVGSAADWARRRHEIFETWQRRLGGWPPRVERPNVERLESVAQPGYVQQHVRVQITPDGKTAEGYLLVPEGKGPFPAVLVPFYEPLTSIGQGAKGKGTHDYGLQLVRRGFVTLSIGTPAPPDESGAETRELLVAAGIAQNRQPLGYLAYVASSCHTALAQMPEVDPARIGIIGLSYGGKWSMFASCLDDRFACAVWSDPGIVFNEKDANVNYWEPWYLGYEPGRQRKPGIPTADNPRTGLYRELIEAGEDLVDLHALVAPRPVLVSGGIQDPPANWRALNHLVQVNRVLGYEHRVALTARPTHVPTPEALELELLFLEHWLKRGE